MYLIPFMDELTFCQKDRLTSIFKDRKFCFILATDTGKHLDFPVFSQKWSMLFIMH